MAMDVAPAGLAVAVVKVWPPRVRVAPAGMACWRAATGREVMVVPPTLDVSSVKVPPAPLLSPQLLVPAVSSAPRRLWPPLMITVGSCCAQSGRNPKLLLAAIRLFVTVTWVAGMAGAVGAVTVYPT